MCYKFYLFISLPGEEETVKEWTEITDGEVLDSDVSISCIPDEITWHGFAKINVTDNSMCHSA